MRKTGLVLMGVALALFIFLPLIAIALFFSGGLVTETVATGLWGIIKDYSLIAGFFRGLADLQLGYVPVFRGLFFTLVPAMLLIGASLFFHEKLNSQSRGHLSLADYVWFSVLAAALLLFIGVYSAPAGSFIHRMGRLSASYSRATPEWSSVFLWISFAAVCSAAISVFSTAQRMKWDKNLTGSIFIGLILSLFFSLLFVEVPIVASLEESVNSMKYSWLRNPGRTRHPASGLNYCQAPYDESGNKVNMFAPNPRGIRQDIEIIGVTNVTIEKVRGNWPLDWGLYGRLARIMGSAENSLLLFDISFLDKKGIFGGSYCGVLFQCTPLQGKEAMRSQTDVLVEALASNKQKVISDYPLETTDEARSTIQNYEARLNLLKERELLRNVKNGGMAQPWARLPLPPIEPVMQNLKGVGYANILKSESGVNTQVPIVARIVNEERQNAPDYDPDRDDFFYPGVDLVLATQYYGVDVQKDVEVDYMAGTVRIKNIPKRSFNVLDTDSFQMVEKDVMEKPNDQREITIPIDQYGRMMINFRGGRYCFKAKELLETTELTPDEAAGYYHNKIALVAMYYATGVGTAKDIHLSPYGDMAGIEHHAHAINTILNQDFAGAAPAWVNLLILLAVGLIMGLYQPRVATWMSFVLALAIAALFTVVTLFVSFDVFSYHHVFPLVLILQFFQLVAFIGFRALTEEENVKFIRTTFSKFVSHDVVEELLANPDAISLGGSKKEISVFFSDVRGFTTISEALSPEGLVQLLNEYLTEMTELIIDYRGTIDKYMGDAIMAFWGAPAKNDDHAYYACVAAIAQYRALQELQKRWSERNIPVLDIGIGLNTGLAVVGNMGSSRRMDYTLMGDTVNLGSRLEGITKTYGVKICISEFTYEKVKDRVYARELDLVRVKGKLEPVRIFELMGLVNESDLGNLKVQHQVVRH